MKLSRKNRRLLYLFHNLASQEVLNRQELVCLENLRVALKMEKPHAPISKKEYKRRVELSKQFVSQIPQLANDEAVE